MLAEVVMKQGGRYSSREVAEDEQVGAAGSGVTLRDWMNLIRAEYLEMPGLSLTGAQVERMWQLGPDLTETLLEELERMRFLGG
jgi:hypothetical protein